MILIKLNIILFISTIITGSQANLHEVPTIIVTRHLPSNEFPLGYSDVSMGAYLLRVPKQLSYVHESGNFTVRKLWPEFTSNKTPLRASAIQRHIDTIQIFFRPPSKNVTAPSFEEQGKVARLIKQKSISLVMKNKKKSKEFPEYWEYLNGVGGRDYFIPIDNVKGPQGLSVQFVCEPSNLTINWDSLTDVRHLPQCAYSAIWDDGHTMYIRFKRKHMKDAISIYKKSIELHDSMIIKTQ